MKGVWEDLKGFAFLLGLFFGGMLLLFGWQIAIVLIGTST